MININKLLESKRVEVNVADAKIDKVYVKQFRLTHHLTQVALANILGVTKKTIEKWEQGVNNVNGSSAVLLRLLNDNPALLDQLYSVKVLEGKQEENYEFIGSKEINLTEKNKNVSMRLQTLFAALI